MNNNNSKRRIGAAEAAQRLGCHKATVKRMAKREEPGFPKPVVLLNRYTWLETEIDEYIQYRAEQSRKDMPHN
jgi:predicted DNA-binding transcriptional regulator AlpA